MAKKVMKQDKTNQKPDMSGIRKLFNTILTESKGTLSLSENKWGATRLMRDGDAIISARSDGNVKITHPIMVQVKKGQKKEQVFKHQGTGYDHMSLVPFNEVTLQMLRDRVKDPKSTKAWHDVVYKDRKDESGTIKKLEKAKERMELASAEADKKVTKKKTDKKTAQIAKTQASKKTRKAVKRVARQPVAATA